MTDTTTKSTPPPAAVTPTAAALRAQALAVALDYAHAQVHEVGGNNRGDQVETFQSWNGGSVGESWCADFVSACFYKGFAELTHVPQTRAGVASVAAYVRAHFVFTSPSCALMWAGATKRGQAKPKTYLPVAGDIVLYDFPVKGHPLGHAHHTGIVVRIDADKTLHTIEGNTSSGIAGSQSDGDGVFARVRSLEFVFGFIHVA